ncbi:signal transduction histidine kinase [Pullulanibacillus pueri]|uniref:histidine kinase n=1 Tax=Pullulanibacillus pueri TaxID=1437324 RepID=A0A8J3EPJ7_9BACL|nr:HAMP domain-containing sensor histidine kinase [Pullulanibacillus pueri]MBM7684210.1 signal transduction histidine kinase [Pullulanibacillus pueri]GGH88971.1 two-component sensor histidine kinase [Pullulanibacillus pueri]
MFRKTLIRLTLLNALIFIILMGILGTAIYYYTQAIIYRSDDNLLTDQMSHSGPGSLLGDPRLGKRNDFKPSGVVIWNSDKKMIQNQSNIEDKYIKKLYPDHSGEIEEKEIKTEEGTVYFRVISKEMVTNGQFITVEFWLLDTQKKLLHTLFLIIVIGWILASLVAVAAGYFLARRALKPIQQAWDKQQAFVSDASHELRTPLTIIQSRIEMLLKSPRAMIQDKLKDISITLNESRRLSKMVSHLLTLARSDANQIEIEKKPVLLNEVLRQIYEQFNEMVSYQGKTLTLNIGHTPMKILGDQEKLHQLLVILIDNAIKFTGEDGHITLTGSVGHHSVTITVADTGIGISEKDVTQIFDRFFQADTSRTHHEGTGLGLSIAKWIVDKHRGRITVESEVNVGTKFILTFPLLKDREGER